MRTSFKPWNHIGIISVSVEFADPALRLQRVLLKSFENWACPRRTNLPSSPEISGNSISPSFCPGALLLQSPLWHIDFPAGASNCGLEIHRSYLKACDSMCAVFAWHAVSVEMCFCLLATFQFSLQPTCRQHSCACQFQWTFLCKQFSGRLQ